MLFFTVEKLKARLEEMRAAIIRDTRPITDVFTCPVPGAPSEHAMSPPPPHDDPSWRPLKVGERWGGDPHNLDKPDEPLPWGMPVDGGHTHWLRAIICIPEEWRGRPVLMRMRWSAEGHAGIEGIAYLDGTTLAGIDEPHPAILLPEHAHEGDHELLIRCYTPYRRSFGGLELQLRSDIIARLAAIMYAILDALPTYRDSDPEKYALLDRINRAYNLLDLREGWQSERFEISAGAALTFLRETLTANLAPGQRPIILATGHAHMDVAWLWPLWRTHQKIAHTVATALHLMERYPEYHFSMSQPQTYAFLKQDDPELYERLRQRVAEGRFEPVGAMWLEPDCNVTGGESLVRQVIHGIRFFENEFGPIEHIVWLPDVFGYSAALPQIMRLAGISCFMTTKISWNQFNRMPYDTFRWRGIDGSEVLAHFVTATSAPVKPNPTEAQFYTYNGSMLPSEVFGTWNHYRQKDINDEVLYIYGHGDGGGGPTEEMLELARVMADLPGFPVVQPGRVEQYFQRLRQRVWNNPRLPVWVGELYLEYHRGTYTSQARTKQNNRQAELLLREAEWLNAWAVTHGAINRQADLDAAWRTVLLNQFHDILPGSSVPLVYVESEHQFAEVRDTVETVRHAAITDLTGSHSNGAAPHLAVFNGLAWDRTECVAIPLEDLRQPLIEGPTQVVEQIDGTRALLVEATVPAFGYAALRAARHPSPPAQFITRRDYLASDEFRIEFDANGEIGSLYDARYEREIIAEGAAGNQLVLYEDRPMFWDAWDIDPFYLEKPYPIHNISEWRVIEEGPLRATVEIARRFGRSMIRQRISLWHNNRRIDFETEVDWQERQNLLRVLFPLRLNAARATCEIQFGAVERPTHRNTSWDWARFEVCAHRWIDLSEGGYGVALLNNGKYGHSLLHNTLGISLLKSAVIPDPQADRGLHRFIYSLLPHAGDWREAQVTRRAYELNAPLHPVTVAGEIPAEGRSFLHVDSDHVIVETIKTADDGDGLIVRMYEAHNQRGQVRLEFGQPVESAVEVDLLERETGPVTVDGRTVRCNVRPFEIKTIRVRLEPPL
ncbi:MAG: alpha-mannosidase [Roseiflexus sp.]